MNRELGGGRLEVTPSPSGLHLLGRLPEGVDDVAVSRRAGEFRVEVPPLSAYYASRPAQSGLLLGFAAHDPARIRAGVRRLAPAVRGGR